jgi:hypothetical protein
MVKVYPKDAEMAKILKHPISKTGFNSDDLAMGVNWPDDSFTARRVRDGDVNVDPPVAEDETRKNEQEPKRERERKQEQEPEPERRGE